MTIRCCAYLAHRLGAVGFARRVGKGAFERARGLRPKLPPHVTVGRHTYGAGRDIYLYPSAAATVSIGNFCSIAQGVKLICHADHPTQLPSSYPLRTHLTRRFLRPSDPTMHNHDAITKGPIEIGHDVWIGERAIVLSGSRIGTGSVVGAGAVVSGEVAPYSIIVGNPGRVIRTRFPGYVDALLSSKWWDLPDEEIAALDPAFYSPDIENFLTSVNEAWRRVRGNKAN